MPLDGRVGGSVRRKATEAKARAVVRKWFTVWWKRGFLLSESFRWKWNTTLFVEKKGLAGAFPFHDYFRKCTVYNIYTHIHLGNDLRLGILMVCLSHEDPKIAKIPKSPTSTLP